MPRKSKTVAIGQRIAAWRHRRSLSQASISRRTGLNPSYLSRLEAGKIQPNLRTAERIASALRISLPELLGPSPPEQAGLPCPVSQGGQCLMDLIDVMAEVGEAGGPERYSPRQLRLIRRFTALVGQNESKVLGALEVLVGKMLEEGTG
jgi:transcriptional regulator with XRE-family HTH domain